MRKILVLAVLILFSCGGGIKDGASTSSNTSTPASSSDSGFSITNASYKIDHTDSTGAVWYSFKVDVKNNATPGTLYVTMKATDANGYEMGTIILSGKYAANESGSLTDTSFLEKDQAARLKEWVIKESSKY